ncbi:LytTR family transcriptional regulator [Pikeienuella piscinae]|uniref:LytTR family transcriptional regulator n=1 Tax=Pikeienuella piscinae TaxID=2748098 RepID=A0A7M3T649_9RHOB|nr:LytTR family DNA-binding domain-containing protein [Pikeienuella piscinae]QIE57480.1 LytTR family transcriptional regulator [Pikeienuella piscinae]
MKSERGPLANGAILAVALALILAAHEVNRQPGWSLFGVYIYWFCRVGMAYLIIVGAYAALGQAMTERSSPYAHVGLAACLSFPPFVMAVTTLDLIIGDVSLLNTSPDVLVSRLGIEAASLIDNHLTTSALLLTPYLRQALRERREQQGQPAAAPSRPAPAPPQATQQPALRPAPDEPEVGEKVAAPGEIETRAEPEVPGLLLASQPPVIGDLLAAEAQEHYVKLKATEQGGMALYRFGDAVRDLGRYRGMQVHRSHWVADDAVVAVIGKRGALRVELTSGEVVPVSRRYELEVEARFADRERRAE